MVFLSNSTTETATHSQKCVFIQIAYLRDFNEDQKKAIETAYAMVKHSPSVAKICLIHGPPGTGKSKTIVGLLYCLLTEVGMGEGTDAVNQMHHFTLLELPDM